MADLWVEFERGGRLPVSLFREESPHNSGELLKLAPLQGPVRHCSWSGQGFVLRLDGMDVRAERQRSVGIGPGALCVEHYPAGIREAGPWTALLLVYGEEFWFKNPFTPAWPLCVVGQVNAGLDELARIGERVLRQGRETVAVLAGQ